MSSSKDAPQSPRDEHVTNSVLNARDDARAQGTKTNPYMPYLPASSSPYAPEDVDASLLTWAETVAPGGYTHRVVARGTRIRLEDISGEACAHVAIFNALEPWERLNAADSVKIPWQAYPGENHPLLSGEGRALATIVGDTSGHHDMFCGTTTDAEVKAKFGENRVHTPYPSGQALLEQGAVKHGLTLRDIPPTVSFFQGIHVEEDGKLALKGSNGEGKHIELLAELPLIILIANSPHPLDERDEYISGPLRIHAWKDKPTGSQDDRFTESPERTRAYLNSIDYAECRGI